MMEEDVAARRSGTKQACRGSHSGKRERMEGLNGERRKDIKLEGS
jgi:hypothetical protein